MKTKELSKEVRHKVVEKHRSGEGYKKISKSLIIPLSTVKSITKRWKMYYNTQTLPRSGRPFKLSSWTRRKLVRDVTVNPTMTLKDLQGSMSEMGVSVHQSTISRSRHKAGLNGQVTRKKPFLKKTNLKACMEFVKKNLDDTAGMWRNVLWSEETNIELFGLNSKCYFWYKVSTAHYPINTIPTVKHGGGSILLWGCFSSVGTVNLVRIRRDNERCKVQENP